MKILKVKRSQVRNWLPIRKKDDNKTRGGKCLIYAGSKNMYGAGVLSALSAYCVGAGYVYLATEPNHFLTRRYPEFLILDSHGKISLKDFSSVGFGPGLGTSKFSLTLLKKLIRSQTEKVVLDADGLNLLSQMGHTPLPKDWILTPHEGEMARLLKTTSRRIKQDRLRAAQAAQKKYGCVILLKGSPTLICDNSIIYSVSKGNVSLGKAGTGDVLTGMIAGFLSQGLSSVDAAQLSAFLHGQIAEDWVKKNDYLSLRASHIIERIPKAIKKLRKK